VGRGAIEFRIDPYYYLPKFVRLESQVLSRSTAKLRDFILAMSGGATPKKEEGEKYYADKETGIPFVRVQNLQVDGQLSLDDVRHINRETHGGLLARSQVQQDDLLVKITGVGRMAVASVPPGNFEGNINQHIVRIRTKDRHTSEILRAWLNTDIAEMLAKRRSTGGTRPALDYPALRSIPVIFDEGIGHSLRAAYDLHKLANKKAQELLASIDDYLLSELGITLPPEPENTIANRIFSTQRRELAGWRFDPYYFNAAFHAFDKAFLDCKFPAKKLNKLYLSINNGIDCRDFVGAGISYVKVADVRPFEVNLEQAAKVSVDVIPERGMIRHGDLLLTRKGTFGLAALARSVEPFAISSEVFRIEHDSKQVLGEYLETLLNSKLCQEQFDREKIGAIMGSLTQAALARITIPLPPIPVQRMICEKVESIRKKAISLRQQAQIDLEAAKRRIEARLLNAD
jgi:type I restriction enzyme S subunit